jgi:hypothetical protein
MGEASKAIIWLLLIAVTALFFFPLAFGSFQSTNGPTVTPNAEPGPPAFILVVLAITTLIIGGLALDQDRLRWNMAVPELEISTGSDLISPMRC